MKAVTSTRPTKADQADASEDFAAYSQFGLSETLDADPAQSEQWFDGAGMVVTYQRELLRYHYRWVTPTRIHVDVFCNFMTIAAPLGTSIRLRLPEGLKAAYDARAAGMVSDNGAGLMLRIAAASDSEFLVIVKEDLAAFAAATRATSIGFQMEVEVLPRQV